jgi:hypothetical protein
MTEEPCWINAEEILKATKHMGTAEFGAYYRALLGRVQTRQLLPGEERFVVFDDPYAEDVA